MKNTIEFTPQILTASNLFNNSTYSIDNNYISKEFNKSIIKSNNNSVIYHYVGYKLEEENLCNPHINQSISDYKEEEVYAKFPLFFKSRDIIKIPVKTQRAIERYIPKALLKDINKEESVAVELCLLFLSNLSDTFYYLIDNKGGWKNLNSEILQEQIDDNYFTYKKIIKALEFGTTKGAIIQCDYVYVKGKKSYSYRLTEPYLGKGVVSYQLQTKYVKDMLNRSYYKNIAKAIKNTICKNLIETYASITIPSIEEIKTEAKRLIKEGYTKKGKRLCFLNKHSKDYFKEPEKLYFVEDSIAIFEYLTKDGFMIPMVSGCDAGGRITDSFTLMPSWIRKLIKINGKKIVEADFSALHPNIAMSIYGGKTEFITHSQIAEDLNVNVSDIKVEHLSFFNKEIWQMKKSILYNYYKEKEPEMMKNLCSDKYYNGYKATSARLFKAEVDVMTKVIEILNYNNIYVGYVYDALFCNPKDYEIVKAVMNDVILCFGIKTTAK